MTAGVRRLFARPSAGPLIALVVVYAVFAALRPDSFASSIAIELMLRSTVKVALCAVGMTLVIVAGGIDLSVGSVVALVTVVIARMLEGGSGPLAAAVAGLAVGVLAGVVNGALVSALRITPFIVTLGTMSALRGAAKGLAREQKIDAPSKGLESLMRLAPKGSLQVLPIGVWIAALVAVAGAVLLGHTRPGRRIVAVGSSADAARLAGISVARTTLFVYAALGLAAGVAGLLELSALTVGDPTDSIGLELQVIAAVVIGGGSLSGGRGSIGGAISGALLMTVIANGATHLGLATWVQEILTGFIIALAVALDRLRQSSS
ncbi:MAG TPA: ABC transporter permease [Polyangiaceae bacterium]|nr:ABC transporter permease [Polyangiaceae bacterium]